MRFLLDGTNFPGSEANTSLPNTGGDVFGKDAKTEVPAGVNQIPLAEDLKIDNSAAAGKQERSRLIQQAKSNLKERAFTKMTNPMTSKLGSALSDKDMFKAENGGAGSKIVKDKVKKKVRDVASKEIGKKIGNEAFKKGIQKGLSKGAKNLAKETGKQVVKQGGKQIASKGVGTVVGGATGIETLGLGFIVGFLLNIAISLFLDDAMDAMAELQKGNLKQGMFLALRAVAKVAVFLWMLVTVILLPTVVGIFIAVPSLLLLNIYMILGAIPAFKKIPHLQGMVWWECAILIAIDIIAFLILVAFIGGIVYYLCQATGLGSGGIQGAAMSVVVSAYDWWYGGSGASFAQDICVQVNAAAM